NHIIKNLSGHVPYLKNKCLFNILNGTTVNIKEIKENCEFYEIELPKEEFTVASIRVDNIQALSVAKSMIQENLTETVEYCSCMPDGLKLISCMPDDFSMALVIFYHDDNYKLLKSSFSILVNFLTSIKDQFQVGSGETVSIGYSGGYVGIENIAKAYSEAHKAAMYKSFVGNNSLISFDSVPREMSGALVISNSDINAVLAAIRSGDRDEAFSILNKFYVKIKNTPAIDVESLRDVVLEMIIILLRYTFENNDAIDDIYGRNLLPYNEIKTLETVDDIIKWINAIVGKMFLKTKDKDDEQSKKVIDIIKRDYASAITVQQVADELYISAYYLMHIFKEQTGKTFNQFVTEYRIKRAKEFIKRDEYKIYEIGSMVGYKDPTYFSYIFKKVTGETPKKYAKSHNVLSLNERS
ncbi:MAG: AraC family transcriptional regulator, partial [Oscillospiraceae bacterium]